MTSFFLNTLRRTCPIQYGSCQVAESIRISICRPCSIPCNDGNSPVCQYLDAKQGLYRKKRPLAACLEFVQNGVCHLNKATLSDITMFCCGKPEQYLVTYNCNPSKTSTFICIFIYSFTVILSPKLPVGFRETQTCKSKHFFLL